jgi:hypothetical protein
MIVPWLTMGGADKFNLDLLQQLTGQGWEVVARNNSTVWNQIVSFVMCSKPAATS